MRVGHSDYHGRTYDPKRLKKTITRVAKKMRQLQRKLKFDAIAFRGSSGAAVAFAVSALTGIHLIYVRKDRNHHGQTVEGTRQQVDSYVILDDFVCAGSTIRTIANSIRRAAIADCDDEPKCVGVCLYDGYNDRSYNLGPRHGIVKAYTV